MATLEEFNIACSSSNDVHNIKWTQKNSKYLNNSKKKKPKNSSSTNIIYTDKIPLDKTSKVFKISDSEKTKKSISGKKFQTSSDSICKIERGFRRPGR
ncbi:hypothetical protein [Nitrosopumilus sp.]|uniref:hypothetical protein n=1 Tax=Nitrosopumilus sp. TaxID=2024843 RepID=UPI0026090C97|nr:hypothetical protein [Nitrosopumilus sp.]